MECTKGQQFKYKNYKNQGNQDKKKKKNDWFRITANQSNKVLKKNNLRSGMDISLSSKHLLFLSLQRHHIKQWRTIIHIWPFRWRPNRPCQQARSHTTDFGITQLTPNKPKIIDHNAIATIDHISSSSSYLYYIDNVNDGDFKKEKKKDRK